MNNGKGDDDKCSFAGAFGKVIDHSLKKIMSKYSNVRYAFSFSVSILSH